MCVCFLRRTDVKGLSHGTQIALMLNKQTSLVNEYHLRDCHVYLPSTRWQTGFITVPHIHILRQRIATGK